MDCFAIDLRIGLDDDNGRAQSGKLRGFASACAVRQNVEWRISLITRLSCFHGIEGSGPSQKIYSFHFFCMRTFLSSFGISFANIIPKTVFLYSFTVDKSEEAYGFSV